MLRFLAPAIALAAVVVVGVMSPRASDEARPLTPADDDRVLQEVPPRDDVARARADLAAHPDDLALATQIARADIARARRDSDPRYLGYAQAALATWWLLPEPPHEALVLRATIRQSNHEFVPALADLELALKQDPDDPQVWLTRAVLLQLRGDFAGAADSCAHLAGLTAPLVVAACRGNLDGATGKAAAASTALAAALARARGVDADTRAWVLTILAELAARQGREQAADAEARYRQAMAATAPDGYLLGSYADFLLDAGRPAEVVTLLEKQTSADNLFLRLVEAESAIGAPAARTHREELAGRYAQSRARGDRIHLREEARYLLHLAGDAGAALALARENFDIQKEPADARILLEAARGDRVAARPALDWMAASGIQDPTLERLRP